MIDIKDLKNKVLPTTRLDLDLKKLSNLEKKKVCGGIWSYYGCNRYFTN
jgi:hypothetical protein